jgi:hypothetical protein
LKRTLQFQLLSNATNALFQTQTPTRARYAQREKLLFVSPKENLDELRAKLKGEVEQQNRQLQVIVDNVVSVNIDLRKRITRTEEKLIELEKCVDQALEQLGQATAQI